MNPVAPKAQKKVPVPEGLDLDSWIHEPLPEPKPEVNERESSLENEKIDIPTSPRETPPKKTHNGEVYYIEGAQPKMSSSLKRDDDMDDIPVVSLSGSDLGVDGLVVEKKKHHQKHAAQKEVISYTIDTVMDAPEGYVNDEDDKKRKKKGMMTCNRVLMI